MAHGTDPSYKYQLDSSLKPTPDSALQRLCQASLENWQKCTKAPEKAPKVQEASQVLQGLHPAHLGHAQFVQTMGN